MARRDFVGEWRRAPIRATFAQNVRTGFWVRVRQMSAVARRDMWLAIRTPLKSVLKVVLLAVLLVTLYTVQTLILRFTKAGINLKSDPLGFLPACKPLDGQSCHSLVYAPAADPDAYALVRDLAARNVPSLSLAPFSAPPGTLGFDVLGLASPLNVSSYLASASSRQYAALELDIALGNASAGLPDLYSYSILYNASGITTTLFTDSGYYDYSLELERLVEETIVARYAAGGSPAYTLQVELMRFPLPAGSLNIATARYAPDFLATYGLSGLVFFAQVAFFILTANIILNEHDSFMRDGLRMMGIKDSIYFAGIFANSAVFSVTSSLLATGVGAGLDIPFFSASPAFVILLLTFGFLAMVSFAVFLATLARTRALANVVFMLLILFGGGCAGVFSTFLGYYVFTAGSFITLVCSLFPPFNFCKVVADITLAVQYSFDPETQSYVRAGPGFSWASRNSNALASARYPSISYIPPPSSQMNALVINTVVYLVAGWYIDSIRTGKSGSSRPWYFCCTPRYWGFYSAPDDSGATSSRPPTATDPTALHLAIKHLPDDVAAEYVSVLVSDSVATTDSSVRPPRPARPPPPAAYDTDEPTEASVLLNPASPSAIPSYSTGARRLDAASSEGSLNFDEQQEDDDNDDASASASGRYSSQLSYDDDDDAYSSTTTSSHVPASATTAPGGGDGTERVRMLVDHARRRKLVLRIVELSKMFSARQASLEGRDGMLAVDELTLGAEEGQILCLLGHSGAGKTTTMSMLTGLLRPSSGDAFIEGLSVVAQMDQIRQRMGVCQEYDIVWPDLTVQEHLRFWARIKGVPGGEISAAVDECIEAVNLGEVAGRKVKNLSGGTRRRLSVVAATLGNPAILFLDEPTNGVDIFNRKLIWDLILKMRASRTIVLTTHSMEEADKLADKIAVISGGRLKAVDSTERLKMRFGGGFKVSIVPRPEHRDELRALLPQILPSARIQAEARHITLALGGHAAGELGAFFRYMERVAGGQVVLDWAVERTGLEDVFLAIMGSAGHDDAYTGFGAPLRSDAKGGSLNTGSRSQQRSLSVAFESEALPLGAVPITHETTVANVRLMLSRLLEDGPVSFVFLAPDTSIPLTEADEHATLADRLAPLALIRNTELEERRRAGRLSLEEQLSFEQERRRVLEERVVALQAQLAEAEAERAQGGGGGVVVSGSDGGWWPSLW